MIGCQNEAEVWRELYFSMVSSGAEMLAQKDGEIDELKEEIYRLKRFYIK